MQGKHGGYIYSKEKHVPVNTTINKSYKNPTQDTKQVQCKKQNTAASQCSFLNGAYRDRNPRNNNFAATAWITKPTNSSRS